MFNTPISHRVFEGDIDAELFTQILATLNHVQPKYISRVEYEKLSGDILSIVGTDTVGDIYELFLPDDLNKTELGELIHFLTQKFHIDKYAQMEKTISQVKLFVELIARKLPESEKNDFTQKLIQESHISPELLSIIRNQTLLFGPSREILKNFEGEHLSPEQLFFEIEDILQKEFYLTFFRKGVNMLRLGMMTMTAGEIPAIKKKEGKIEIRIPQKQLDQKERLLRDKIGIEKIKAELETVRKTGNQKIIQSVEKKSVERIMYFLYEYPYQFTQENLGYQPSKILEHKEIYCVGFSALMQGFLSEIGIEHYGLTLLEHSAIEVVIGNKRYYCDLVAGDELFEMKVGKRVGVFEEVVIDELVESKNYILRYDAASTILAQILSNLGNTYAHNDDFLPAAKIFQISILLNPYDASSYRYLADNLRLLKRYKESLFYLEKAIELHPKQSQNYNDLGVILNVLKDHKGALEKFDIAISLTKKNPDYYLNKAKALHYLKQTQAAIDTAKYALKLDTHLAEGYNDLGLYYFEMHDYTQGFQYCDKAIELSPKDGYFYFNKGLGLEKVRNFQVANLYKFVCDAMDKVKTKAHKSKQKQMILDLVQAGDFDGVRLYLLGQEKNSN